MSILEQFKEGKHKIKVEECVAFLNFFKYEDRQWELPDEEPQVRDHMIDPEHLDGRREYDSAHKEWEENHPKQVETIKEAALCLIHDLMED